ncbi:MAG: hypothetical protein HUJ80_02885 [Firmicutes bacterium]|nr:hypothetical protein [Bacillota bacterium]
MADICFDRIFFAYFMVIPFRDLVPSGELQKLRMGHKKTAPDKGGHCTWYGVFEGSGKSKQTMPFTAETAPGRILSEIPRRSR